MIFPKTNTVFGGFRYKPQTFTELKKVANIYYDKTTNTLINITELQISYKDVFAYVTINNTYMFKIRHRNQQISPYWNDDLPYIYESIDKFMLDITEKIRTSRNSYEAALVTITNYDKQREEINTILTGYPEYFI